jgi:hypothetical protein
MYLHRLDYVVGKDLNFCIFGSLCVTATNRGVLRRVRGYAVHFVPSHVSLSTCYLLPLLACDSKIHRPILQSLSIAS